MNNHHTKYVGDLAVARVLTDLMEKHWFVMQPCISEHLPFDLLAYRMVDDKPEYLRIQVKAANEFRTAPAPGRKAIRYTQDTIDLFATYLEDVGVCAYFPISLIEPGKTVTYLTTKVPNSPVEFWWYEDFLEPNPWPDGRFKATYRRFKDKLDYVRHAPSGRPKKAPVEKQIKLANPRTTRYPSAPELQRLVWEKSFLTLGAEFGVSDVAVRKYCKSLDLNLPPMGYFSMNEESKSKIRPDFKKLEES